MDESSTRAVLDAEFQLLSPESVRFTELVKEWDDLSPIRARQIRERQDASFWNVMAPAISELLVGTDLRRVLDVGCGTGELTQIIARDAESVLGIDPSEVAVTYARSLLRPVGNAAVIRTTIEGLQDGSTRFTAAYANMVLMDIMALDEALKSISRRLFGRAAFVFSIPHPVYWPAYRGYDSQPWFEYSKELIIRSRFRITRESLPLWSTHVHRPVASYVRALSQAGFGPAYFFEPMPAPSGDAAYDASWTAPRYLFGATMRRKRAQASDNARSLRGTWRVDRYPKSLFGSAFKKGG